MAASYRATPQTDQAASEVVAPRYIANPHARPKRLRQDRSRCSSLQRCRRSGPLKIVICAMVGTDVLTCGCADVLYPRLAASYQPHDIVAFHESKKERPRAGIGYHVEAIDAKRGMMRLFPDKGKAHDWQPARWGSAQAEAFVEAEQDFPAGDEVQFTRNNYRADRLDGQVAEGVAIDPAAPSMVVEREDGRRDMLHFDPLADRHVRHGRVRTIHKSQGATCDRVMAHLEGFRANTVDAAPVYVAISRVGTKATVYTDSRVSLTDAFGLRDGAQARVVDDAISKLQK